MLLNLVKARFALLIKSAAVKDDPLLVLYLCLDIADCIGRLHLNCNDLAIGHLHENLHAQVEVQGRVVLDQVTVVSQCFVG